MKELTSRHTNRKADMFMAEKEQEFFTIELNSLKEKLKEINWKINKEFCNKILNCEKPPLALISSICDTFLFVLDCQEISWNKFKVYIVKAVGVI
jgi:hypothetical protein